MTTNSSAQGYVADARNDQVLVNVNGAFVPRNEAVVSVFDSGFALGDGVWEGLRLVKGRLISLDAHLDRLFEGARSIALDIGLTREGVVKAVRDTLDRNGMTDGAHVRLMITRGLKSTPNQDPRFVIGGATIVIVAEYKKSNPEAKARGAGKHVRDALQYRITADAGDCCEGTVFDFAEQRQADEGEVLLARGGLRCGGCKGQR